MKYLLGTKENMTQIFTEEGRALPVTMVKVSPVTVTQVKTTEKDGYTAVQVGAGERKEKNISKPVKGHLKKLGNFMMLKEYRGDTDVKVGDTVTLDAFAEGDKVKITAVSKGKGFQGAVKRHGFAGGRRSHGQKHSEREVGSIGATGPQRVLKGQRMPGRMGTDTVSLRGVKIVKIDTDANLVYLKGAVPGRRGTVVEIRG